MAGVPVLLSAGKDKLESTSPRRELRVPRLLHRAGLFAGMWEEGGQVGWTAHSLEVKMEAKVTGLS